MHNVCVCVCVCARVCVCVALEAKYGQIIAQTNIGSMYLQLSDMVDSDRSFMVDPLSYFSFKTVLHDWCNKGRGMCYPVCGMMHIKEPLLLIGKSSLCGGNGFHFSLSELSFTICQTPYNRK